MQILVAVANIPVRPWKTDVEKASMGTAVGHGSVDPKGRTEEGVHATLLPSLDPKGKRVNIPAPGRSSEGVVWVSLRGCPTRRRGRRQRFYSLRDAGDGPGKSFLFLLRDQLPGKESFRERETVASVVDVAVALVVTAARLPCYTVKHRASSGVRGSIAGP